MEKNNQSIDKEPEENENEYEIALEKLKKRCEGSNIEFQRDIDFLDEKYAAISLPRGREKKNIYLASAKHIDKFLSIPFEYYGFIGEYEAICSYRDNYIEGGIVFLIPRSTNVLKRQLLGISSDVEEDIKDSKIFIKNQWADSSAELEIGPASDIFMTLVRPFPRLRKSITLKIRGIKINNHDQTLDLLERISNSLFFQIDLMADLSLALAKRRKLTRRIPSKKMLNISENLEFPKFEYDSVPMKLYWYARSASGMPLLQFLAFYQALEYYFPIHSETDARRKIRTLLKNPSFRFDRDSDIAKILAVIKTRGSYGFGEERSQLRSVLQECINPNELREFLTDDDSKTNFFSSKAKGLTDRKLPINDSNADMRNDVADRLYEIRCKIVHTKSENKEGRVELLLPFTKEVELLENDIELIQFICRQVIIASSAHLNDRL